MSDQTQVELSAEAARALADAGRTVTDWRGKSYVGGWHLSILREPYRFADPEPLTAEQAAAVCRACPKACVKPAGGSCVYAYREGAWKLVNSPLKRAPFDHPDERTWADWHLVPDPSAKARVSNPPETTDRLSVAVAWAEEAGVGVPAFVDDANDTYSLRAHGDCVKLVCRRSESNPLLAPPFTRLPKPTIEPRSGAELRRWLVETGREAKSAEGNLCRWSADTCIFQQWGHATGEWFESRMASTSDCTPADGKPW